MLLHFTERFKAAGLDPLSVATTARLSEAAYLSGRYAAAIRYANETVDEAPQRYEAFETLGLAYEARGQMPSAIAAFERMTALCGSCRPEAAALLAGAYARVNRPSEARAEIGIAQAHPNDVHPEDVAIDFYRRTSNRPRVDAARPRRCHASGDRERLALRRTAWRSTVPAPRAETRLTDSFNVLALAESRRVVSLEQLEGRGTFTVRTYYRMPRDDERSGDSVSMARGAIGESSCSPENDRFGRR